MSKSLALFAFECLVSELESRPHKTLLDLEQTTESKTHEYPKKAPLFVTWKKSGNLRGCIGTFSNTPIESGISQYALISAFEDTRFSPIKKSELPHLSVSITILDHFVEIVNPQDWNIGRHGLKVEFSHNNSRYSGTFLPVVAEEQGWTRLETLWNLLGKAGFRIIDANSTLDYFTSSIAAGRMTLVRYEGLKCDMDYHNFITAAGGVN